MSDPRFGHGRLGEVEAGLEPELRDQFRSLVEDTHFLAEKRGWHPWRQYQVMADLVRGGWRGPACSKQNAPKE